MSLAQSTLVQRVRRILGDTPYQQVGSTSNASTTTVTVSDSSKFDVGAIIEFQNNGEQVMVKTITNATTVEVWARGHNGTTAATQASGTIFIDPEFTYIDITDGLDRCIQTLWPYAWKKVSDTVTPDTTTQWFDLAADAIDLIQVVQRYGDSSQYLARFGEKDSGLPVAIGLNMPTAYVASGVGIRFPNGFAHSTNVVYIDYRAKITTTLSSTNYSDLSDGLLAEAVVYGTAAKLVGVKEVPLVTSRDVSQGDTPIGPQARLTAASYLSDMYRKTLNQARDELMRTIPPMNIWS